jgi:hypothetical protein
MFSGGATSGHGPGVEKPSTSIQEQAPPPKGALFLVAPTTALSFELQTKENPFEIESKVTIKNVAQGVERTMNTSTTDLLAAILPPHEKSDMVLVGALPRLFATRDSATSTLLLDSMCFWYHDTMHMTGQVYWSENHSLMYMSCDVLLHELAGRPVPVASLERLERMLVIKAAYGLAEFMSPVYIPFTIASLLNLHDWCAHTRIRELATSILDEISTMFLALVLPDASLITPSARSYARHRESCRGHHITLFLEFLLNGSVPLLSGDPSQALFQVLSGTRYTYTRIVETTRRVYRLSPPMDSLLQAIESFPDDVFVTMLWSHGAYVPLRTRAAARCLRFMDRLNLWQHPHFKALAGLRRVFCCLPAGPLASIVVGMASLPGVRPRAEGALLTDATMVVYRQGLVTLSSLAHHYNAGLPCYQQWPWAINLAGVPVWCAFGDISTGGLSAVGNAEASTELSTSRVMPRMAQDGAVLVADYTPAYWMRTRPRPVMRFKTADFHDHGTHGKWIWARRETAWMAYTIDGMVVKVVVCDDRFAEITALVSAVA